MHTYQNSQIFKFWHSFWEYGLAILVLLIIIGMIALRMIPALTGVEIDAAVIFAVIGFAALLARACLYFFKKDLVTWDTGDM